MIRAMAAAFAVLFLFALPAGAQVAAPWTEDFDAGGAGWSFSNSSTEGVGWAVDGDPGITAVGDGLGGDGVDGPVMGGFSLNYNDGTDYEEDISAGANKGVATSPVIDVSGLAGSIFVSFDLNFETDFYLTGDATLDSLTLEVSNGAETLTYISFTIGDNTTAAGAPYFLHAGPMGTFRRIGFNVGLFTGAVPDIRLRFVFTTSDDTNNAFSGYFIDNLQVCSDSVAPAAPVNLSPADGATVVGGPGIPLALDWSDAADSTDCGAGAVWLYIWQVYDANTLVLVTSGIAYPSDAVIPAGLAAGDYLWDVQAIDGSFFLSPLSTQTSFTIEPPLAPLAPASLFVNESKDGAQAGDAGFVDPVIDEQPVFSAVYLDANSIDFAHGYRFQVSQDPTFTTVDFDSGAATLGTPLAKDARSQDLAIPISLDRDTVYYWRIRFTDASGLTGPFSGAQSFRIGDDFEFGVRHGSSHRSRHGCWVATAAWGGVSPEVAALREFRSAVLDRSGAGSWFSRAYHAGGRPVASVTGDCAPLRLALASAAAATSPLASAVPAGLALLLLGAALVRRLA
ncbi:MAG: hypothetical protein HUU15_05440 [Candidatus Brocadiae bacterium]|nr:hypothetical protein [Candidatus Brocadiia bacterium]